MDKGPDPPEEFVPFDQGGRGGKNAAFEAMSDGLIPVPVKETPRRGSSFRQKTEEIIEEARRKAEHIEREAFEKGFAQGEKAGLEMMENSLETTSSALAGAAAQLEETQRKRAGEMEEEVIRLALALARKIIQREVATDPELVVNVVRAVIEKAQLRGDVKVWVNPMDRETMVEMSPGVLKSLEGVRALTIETDDAVARGGALLECAMGELDVRLARQLSEIERGFEKILDEGAKKAGP